MSEAPYLIHEAAIAPHVTGRGVLLVVDGLKKTTYYINIQLSVAFSVQMANNIACYIAINVQFGNLLH